LSTISDWEDLAPANYMSGRIALMIADAYKNTKSLEVTRFKTNISPDQYRQEFGSLQYAGPRQTGHTTAALQVLAQAPMAIMFVHKTVDRYYLPDLIKRSSPDINDRSIDDILNRVYVLGSSEHRRKARTITTDDSIVIFDTKAMMNSEEMKQMVSTLPAVRLIVTLQ